MKTIIVVDDNMGMMFNNRRLSMDAELRQYIIRMAEGKVIRMNSYSAAQFKDFMNCNIIVEDDFLQKAEKDDLCFVENENLIPFLKDINTFILFKWNRTYPSDMKFDISLKSWKLERTDEFVGNSHKTITMEEYKR